MSEVTEVEKNHIDLIPEMRLVEEARAGSKQAFCELYGMYKDKLYRYALYRLGSPEDAEDAVSECVLAAWQGITRLKNAEAFGGWMFRILHNCCVKKIKNAIALRDNMQNLYESGPDSSGGSIKSQDPSLSVELREALAQLDEDERETVLLSVLGGLTSREISDITGLTPGSVRSKLSRSLASMRSFLS